MPTRAPARRRLPNRERVSRPAAWEPIAGQVKESNEERMPIGPESDRCRQRVWEPGGLFSPFPLAGVMRRSRQLARTCGTEPAVSGVSNRANANHAISRDRRDGHLLTAAPITWRGRGHLRSQLHARSACRPRWPGCHPGCPNRPRFSAMLTDAGFEMCGTEIIGNAEKAATSSGVLTGMRYRADVE